MRWKPDTCECVIEENYDPGTDSFSFVATVQACPFHAAVANTADHYAVVLAENQAKNDSMREALELIPGISATFVTSDGGTGKWFKRGLEPSWRYTVVPGNSKRNFALKLRGIANADAKELQTALRSRLRGNAPVVDLEGD